MPDALVSYNKVQQRNADERRLETGATRRRQERRLINGLMLDMGRRLILYCIAETDSLEVACLGEGGSTRRALFPPADSVEDRGILDRFAAEWY